MAPESNSGNPTTPEAQASQLVRVPGAAAGERVVVAGAAGANYQFDFNPGEANMARDGANLSFDVDGGGTVVIENFFVLGDDKQFPNFVLEDGEEYQSLALLEGAGLDTTPAAGPAASATPPGSGTNYADDPGALINGIDRLGDLGTFHWGRSSEVPDPMVGTLLVGGTVGFDSGTGFGPGGVGLFQSFVYEDGRPVQHQYYKGEAGDTLEAGRIVANIQPNFGSSVASITISGFPAGTQVWIGDPAGNGQLVTLTGGSYSFSLADFNGPGVYFIPPGDSDADFSLNYSVVFTAPGAPSVTESGSFFVVVDAVADKPVTMDVDADATIHGGAIVIGEDANATAKQYFEDGWAKDNFDRHQENSSATNNNADATPDVSGATYTIPFHATAKFGDFSDNSEHHYILIEVPGTNSQTDAQDNNIDGFGTGDVWNCGNVKVNGQPITTPDPADRITLYYDAQGNMVDANSPDVDYSKEFFQVEVPNSLIPDSGEVKVDVDLVAKDTKYDNDISFDLTVGTKAEEQPTENDPFLDNNVSYTFDDVNHTGDFINKITLDTVDSKFIFQVGWASEGNNDAKHRGEGEQNTYKYTGTEAVAYEDDLGARITMSLGNSESGETGATGVAGDEYITQVVLTLTGGDLYVNGVLVNEAATTPDAYEYNGALFKVEGNKVTITPVDVDNNPDTFDSLGRDLSNLDLVFRPNGTDATSSTDLKNNIEFQVTVENENTGAKAVFDGTSTVVIDAVADLADLGKLSAKYDDSDGYGDAARPGETMAVKGSISFDDNDGSEVHYMVVNIPAGWSFSGMPAGWEKATAQDIYDQWNDVGGAKLPTAGSLQPHGNAGTSEYLLVEIATDGTVTLYARDAGGDFVAIPHGGNPDPYDSITVTPGANEGEFTYSLNLDAPSNVTGDTSSTVSVQGVTVEDASKLDGEYDYNNNISVTDAQDQTLKVAPVTSGLKMETNFAFEGDAANKHLPSNVGSKVTTTGDEGKITLTLTGSQSGDNEFISKVFLSLQPDAEGEYHGSIYVGGVALPHAGLVLEFDASGKCITEGPYKDASINDIRYTPDTGDTSDVDVKIDMAATIVDPDSGDTKVVSNMGDGNDGWKSTGIADAATQSEAATGTSTVQVDAVADRPEDLSVKSKGDIVDPEPGQTSAQPGDKVTLTVNNVQFFDYTDDSEAHFVVISQDLFRQSNNTDSGLNLSIAKDQVVTISDSGTPDSGYTQVVTITNGKIVSIVIEGPNGYSHTITDISAYANGTSTASGGYFKIPVLNEFLEHTTDGSVSTSVDIVVPTPTGDSSVYAKVGGLADEDAYAGQTGDAEIYDQNNASLVTDKANFDIGVVTSKPVVTITLDHIYENLTPNAHLGLTDTQITDYWTAVDAWKNGTGPKPAVPQLADGVIATPVLDADGILVPDNQGATIELGGMKSGETATFVILYFTGEGLDGQASVTLNGVTEHLQLDVNTGRWYVEFTDVKPNGNAAPVFEFKPGMNYSHHDIKVEYEITLRDDSSLQEKTCSGEYNDKGEFVVTNPDGKTEKTAGLEIDVDAVSQHAKLDNADGSGDGSYEKAVPGEVANIDLKVSFDKDVNASDGSEEHFVYIERVPGWSPATIDIGGVTYYRLYIDGNPVDIPASDVGFQNFGDEMYWAIKLPNSELPGDGSQVTISVPVNTPTSAGESESLKAGVGSRENFDKVREGGDTEFNKDNNDNYTLTKVTVEFDKTSSASAGSAGYYERGESVAHTGYELELAAVKVPFNFTDTFGDRISDNKNVIESIKLTPNAEDTGLGNLYIMTAAQVAAYNSAYSQYVTDYKSWYDGGMTGVEPQAPNMANYGTVIDGKTIDRAGSEGIDLDDYLDANGNFNGQIVFKPTTEDGKYHDQDYDYSYEVKTSSTSSGDTNTSTGTGTIIGDAVAHKPVMDEDKTTDKVTEDHGEKVTLNIAATFTDIDDTKVVTDPSTGEKSIQWDASTDHFLLVEVEANWTVRYVSGYDDDGDPVYTELGYKDIVIGPDGVSYYKIPVDNLPEGSITLDPATGKVSANAIIEADTPAWHPALDSKGTLQTGAMSVDNGSGDGELTWHNNMAFVEGNGVEYDLKGGPDGKYSWIHFESLYENNTPEAHTGDTDTEQFGELVFHKGEDITDGSAQSLVVKIEPVDGEAPAVLMMKDSGGEWVEVPTNGNGDYVITNFDGTYALKVNVTDNGDGTFSGPWSYKDGDIKISYEFNDRADGMGNAVGTSGGSATAIVDAVAQQGTIDTITSTDGAGDSAGKNAVNTTDTFKVTAKFEDYAQDDDSENHWVLVEHIPGWEAIDANGNAYEAVALPVIDKDGVQLMDANGNPVTQSYYRIPVTHDELRAGNGTVEVDVTMRFDKGAVNADPDTYKLDADGKYTWELGVGVMSQEKATGSSGDLESRIDNNTSINIGGTATVEYSPVDSKLSVSITQGYENNELKDGTGAGGVQISLEGFESGKADVLEELSFSYDSDRGTLKLDGQTIASGTQLTPAQIQLVLAGKLVFDPKGYSNDNIDLKWSATVSDTHSGDVEKWTDKVATIPMDAVAHGHEAGKFTVKVFDDSRDHSGVQSGESAFIEVQCAFKDDGSGGEEHWAVFEQLLDYPVLSVKIQYFDDSGNLTNEVTIPKDQIATLLGQGDQTSYYAVRVDDPNAKVIFEVDTPDGYTSDTSNSAKAGTISIAPEADGESTFSNNWKEDINKVDIATGVVETQTGDVTVSGIGSEGDSFIQLDVDVASIVTNGNSAGGYNETVTGLVITGLPNAAHGTLWLDDGLGNKTKINVNDTISADDFDKIYFEPAGEHLSGDTSWSFKANVKDNASGATSQVPGTATITVEGVATAPTAVTANISGYTESGFTVHATANFADHDGSENHFFLVAAIAGLTLVDGLPLEVTSGKYTLSGTVFDTDLPDGSYYYVQASANGMTENPAVDLQFTTDSNYTGTGDIVIYGGSYENGVLSGNSAAGITDGAIYSDDATIYGTAGNDVIYGGAGDNIIYGNGFDTIFGGAGNDEIHAGDGGSVIDGGIGDDTIFAGKGDDLLTGGQGEDIFVWTKDAMTGGTGTGIDTITDFSTTEDKINFSDLFGNATGLDDLLNNGLDIIGTDAANSKFSFTNGDTTIEAKFSNEELMLTLSDSSGVDQQIVVQSTDFTAITDSDAAAALLAQILQSTNI